MAKFNRRQALKLFTEVLVAGYAALQLPFSDPVLAPKATDVMRFEFSTAHAHIIALGTEFYAADYIGRYHRVYPVVAHAAANVREIVDALRDRS